MIPVRRVSAKKYRGAGDVVHAVAGPAAKLVDRLFGTNVSGCGGCAARREAWNGLLPFGGPDIAENQAKAKETATEEPEGQI